MAERVQYDAERAEEYRREWESACERERASNAREGEAVAQVDMWRQRHATEQELRLMYEKALRDLDCLSRGEGLVGPVLGRVIAINATYRAVADNLAQQVKDLRATQQEAERRGAERALRWEWETSDTLRRCYPTLAEYVDIAFAALFPAAPEVERG